MPCLESVMPVREIVQDILSILYEVARVYFAVGFICVGLVLLGVL